MKFKSFYVLLFSLLTLMDINVKAQGSPQFFRVTGSVKEASGEPLPGVTIIVKGTVISTRTDVNGMFTIQAPSENSTLVFSFLGYASQEHKVGQNKVLNVVLKADSKSLNEVVVVAYGTQNRKEVTASIASVKGKDIANVPVTNLDAALQGKAPGVQVVQNSGAPGDETYIRIRGNGSLFGENRPLYVIDGVPMNNIAAGEGPMQTDGQRITTQNDINMNDIESIEVLKDAAAASLYGSRAGNGVILITTKKGKQGRSRFNFNMYSGVATVTRRLDLLTGDQYVDMIEEARANARNNPPPYNINIANDDRIVRTGNTTNWQDAVFQSAPISNFNVSVAGGTNKTSHYVSAGYFDQTGTIIGQRFKRFNGRINYDFKATDKLKLGVNLTGNFSKNNRRDNSFSGQSILALALIQNPNNPIYNPDGTYYRDALNRLNPVMLANTLRYVSNTNRYVGNVFGEYKLLKDLTFKTTFGFDNLSVTDDRYQSREINAPSNPASGSASVYSVMLWNNENTLTYSGTVAKNHKFSALLGQSLQESALRKIGAAGTTNSTDVIQSVSGFSTRTQALDLRSKWGLASYFARTTYNYMDRFMLQAAIRADGSSRFGKNNKFGYFPSISGGWNISEEKFMEDSKLFSELKLRASIGVTGNQEGLGSDFPSLATYSVGSNYGTLPGISAGSLTNADLSWESTTQTDIGLDFSLFNNRISVVADVYKKATDKLIFKLEIPYTSGFNRTFGANIGNLENRGLEVAVITRNFVNAFKWSTDFNISFNRNKITYLPTTVEGDPSSADFTEALPNAFNTTNPTSIFRVGESVGSFFGYRSLGVDPNTGDMMYEDLNKDGIITTLDRQILGNALPKHSGGFTNNFSYKGVDLSVFFQWSFGNDVYNQTRNLLERMNRENNGTTNTLRRWTPQNRITDVPRAIYDDPAGADGRTNGEVSQRFIEDGSFLRLKNVTLGYNLSSALTKKLRIGNARFYVSGQNLLLFTKYSGYDPESQNQQVKNSQLGIDWATQPQPRTIMMGLNVGF
ncbi:SusC/RagA family TonB-linked outer membrane protein [Desertivirga xinjiangensis]|uniref:SusC/RagA family TonB-linked outer membrane protein n=1 Tax=Desertivirga xinjiangensis TaxID=539206 RepID=UPI00210A9959|nr:TonB-dependent receptor [Pedobacter xinjiangensis]